MIKQPHAAQKLRSSRQPTIISSMNEPATIETENLQDTQYRRACRKFYHQSTSFISDDDDSRNNDHNEKKKELVHPADLNDHYDTAAVALLLEAIDHLTEGGPESYMEYLREQEKRLNGLFSKFQELVVSCGLPAVGNKDGDNDHSLKTELSDPIKLQRWMTIRNEERCLAHERNIQVRLQRVQELLKEHCDHWNSQAPSKGIKVTTKADLLGINRTMKAFMKKYANDSCVATHPLVAGMRKLLEDQLQVTPSNDSSNDAVCLLWRIDAAVISEAVVANEQGANDGYVRDAITALATFLIWLPNDIDRYEIKDGHKSGDDTSNSERLTFAIQPWLSDRTLEMLLRILPPYKDLHGRPTGNIIEPSLQEDDTLQKEEKDSRSQSLTRITTRLFRENIDGEHDELDFCTVWLHNAMRIFS